MAWNDYLYLYSRKYGGQYLGGEEDDGLLVLPYKEQPLAVDLKVVSGGRGGSFSYVRARIPARLDRPYTLTVGSKKKLSAGVNAALKAVDRGLDLIPNAPGLTADYGFPEVTKDRLIRTDNRDFTRQVLMDLDFRNALLACPWDRVEVRPGPEEGLHLITVTTDGAIGTLAGDGGGWYLGSDAEFMASYGTREEREKQSRRVEAEFFPRMDRFLDLARRARDAVMAWRM